MARYSTEFECRKLVELAGRAAHGIIEIGVLDGETTALMAAANTSVPIYGIDPIIQDSMNKALIGNENLIKKNLAPFNKFSLIKDFSFNVVRNWNRRFDFIFIDGDHRYDSVKKDFEDWWPKLEPGGFLAMHDSAPVTSEPSTFKGHAGPTRLAMELKASGVRCVGIFDTITVFRKNLNDGEIPSYTIGIAFHNKAAIVADVVSGLANSLKKPCDYIFILDGCTDETETNMTPLLNGLAGNVSVVRMNNVYEKETNNYLLSNFRTKYLSIFQDDKVLHDKLYLANLETIYSIYGRKVGVIGCRDGFGKCFRDMVSSTWSESCPTRRLKNGQFATAMMVCRGPITVSRELVKAVGLLGESFDKTGSYSDMDYCMRANKAGFTNFIMGTDLEHRHKENPIFEKSVAYNKVIFKKKWPGVIHG